MPTPDTNSIPELNEKLLAALREEARLGAAWEAASAARHAATRAEASARNVLLEAQSARAQVEEALLKVMAADSRAGGGAALAKLRGEA
jgi:hypothetical protein